MQVRQSASFAFDRIRNVLVPAHDALVHQKNHTRIARKTAEGGRRRVHSPGTVNGNAPRRMVAPDKVYAPKGP
jgi:hypothetical protein